VIHAGNIHLYALGIRSHAAIRQAADQHVEHVARASRTAGIDVNIVDPGHALYVGRSGVDLDHDRRRVGAVGKLQRGRAGWQSWGITKVT